MTVELPGLPPLTWTHSEGQYRREGDVLVLTSDAEVDWTNDATGAPPSHTSTSLAFDIDEPFQLSARVSVDAPRTTFDAAVLTLWVDKACWAKLCFENSPQGEEMVVSVVTDRFSDDANGPVILDGSVWLRVSSLPAGAYAFHYSTDWRRLALRASVPAERVDAPANSASCRRPPWGRQRPPASGTSRWSASSSRMSATGAERRPVPFAERASDRRERTPLRAHSTTNARSAGWQRAQGCGGPSTTAASAGTVTMPAAGETGTVATENGPPPLRAARPMDRPRGSR